MPKISLWKPIKTNDFVFSDRISREHFDLGGTGVFIHKYLGPDPTSNANDPSQDNFLAGGPADETTIQDVLFLENRDRKYEQNVYELRGVYNPSSEDFNLTQFGLFLSEDIIIMLFNTNNVVERMGRKLISGDVIELPHDRDDLLLDPEAPAINRFYVIEDVSDAADGYGPTWYPHILRCKCNTLRDSQEFKDILGDGSEEDDLKNLISTYNKDIEISERLLEEAAFHVPHDSKFYETAHLFISEKDGKPQLQPWTGDGKPPNGLQLVGSGDSFPTSGVNEGDYFLRTDFEPNRLFRRMSGKWCKIEDDTRKTWTAANKILSSFIKNDNVTELDDGTTEPERQALSKAVKPRVDV